MPDRWPLIGRDDELDRVRRLWSRSATSLVVAGARGAGKTRFALECLELAGSRGWRTARLMEPTAPVLPELLAGMADGVVLVDDAHLLDDPSAAALHDAVTRRGIGAIVTTTTGAPAAAPVQALWKNDIAERIDLPPLDEDGVSRILATVLAGPVEAATVTGLATRCAGSVLYLRELVLGALADGTLTASSGLWRLTADPQPSARLVELVEAELPDRHRPDLEVIAYAEPADHAVLARLMAGQTLDDLERDGLLTTRRAEDLVEVRLRHPVHGEVLRARTPLPRTQAIARRLLEASTQPGDPAGQDALQLATWSLDARTTSPANLLAAATTARWRYDFPLAERLVTSAVLAGAGFDAELLAAQLACLRGDNDEAERLFVDLQRRADTDSRRAHVAVNRLDNLALYRGDMEVGLRVAEEAEASIVDGDLRDLVSARKVGILIAARGPRAAADAAGPLLERASGAALVWTCLAGAYSFGRTGQIEKALHASDIGYVAHRELAEPTDWYPWFHRLTRCMALAQAGRLVEAEELALAQHSRGVADSSPEAQAFFSWHLVKVVGERGHVHDAAHHGREAVALLGRLGRPQYARECQIALAHALALSNRGTEAAGLLQQLDSLDLPPTPYTAVELPIAHAWAAAALGDLPQAVDRFRDAAQLGTRVGDLAGATSALHAVARLGHPREVADRLAELCADVEGELAPARVLHTTALCTASPDGLDAAADAFAAMGADLLAAEAAADRAEALLRSGHRRDSNAARRRARELAARCPGAATPVLRRLEVHASLTRAEYEVALLAAGGNSSKVIADKLQLSVRTVQNHLQHTYDKLGIHNRGQLPDAMEGWSQTRSNSTGSASTPAVMPGV